MADSIEARVARGAALLDEHEPNWFRRIDVGTLDLTDCRHCVVGQVYGGEQDANVYYHAVEELGLNTFGEQAAFGFYDVRGNGEWRALDEAWIAVIKDRWERLA